MPVFNTARYLPDALSSIASQTFRDFEFIVIDDGSSDGSMEILRQFAMIEPRMRMTTRSNRGVIATRNELLSAARGELVAWMDSDDISLPHRLQRQIEVFRGNPSIVCLGSAAQCIDPEGNFLNVERYPPRHAEILMEQEKGGAMRFPTTVMRRDTALHVGGFREPFRIGEDFDLLLRISELGTMANLTEILYCYRQHVSSVCARLGSQWPIYRDQILQLARERHDGGKDRLQNGESLEIAGAVIDDRRQVEWRVYLDWAGHAYGRGNASLAWKYACAALARRPASATAWKLMARILVSNWRPRGDL